MTMKYWDTYCFWRDEYEDQTALPVRIAQATDRAAGELHECLREDLERVPGDDRFAKVELAIFEMLLRAENIRIEDIASRDDW